MHEELAINSLPPKMQRRMASLCLSGWRFKYEPFIWWRATRYSKDYHYVGSTLLTLLMQMDCEYSAGEPSLPDGATLPPR